MGTDIHMACEIRENGQWNTLKKRAFKNAWYKEDSDYEPFTHEFTEVPYNCRCYNLFGILADVRNGSGFAGCRIGEPFIPICKPKGLPDDICEETYAYLSNEHTPSFLTLEELEQYDWTRMHRDYGIITEEEYRGSIMHGKNPESWCGGVDGPGIVILTETEMVDLIFRKRKRISEERYYTSCYFNPSTYAECSGGFYDEVLPVLRTLVPKGGTNEDVRIVFDFDS